MVWPALPAMGLQMNALIVEKFMLPASESGLWGERRAKPRVVIPFRSTVHGLDVEGLAFEVATVVDNMAGGGLYLRIMREVREGAKLLINVEMNCHQGAPEENGGMSLEVYGTVRRVDRMAGRAFGVAVSFTSSLFHERAGV